MTLITSNNILVTTSTGAVQFSNNLSISSVTITSSLTTNYLTVNSTATISSSNVVNESVMCLSIDSSGGINTNNNNFTNIGNPLGNITLTGNAINITSMNDVFINSDVNIDGNLSCSTLNTDFISTTGHITLLDTNLSTVVLDNIGSTLYVNGHPVITDANISTVSTVFWDDGPNGTIFNKKLDD